VVAIDRNSRGFLAELGSALFLPDLVGWQGAVWSVVAVMAVWYLLAAWNEQRKRLANSEA